MANPVVHFEIGAADDGPLVKFYGELFGWGLRAVPGGNYSLVDARGGGGINGGIGRSQTGQAWSAFYVEVDDPQAFLDKAGSLGATRAYGPKQVDDHTETGAFRDPAGNVFGVYHHGPH
jgi:uncharacterized protein